MYDLSLRARARSLRASGPTLEVIADELGVSYSTVRRWTSRRSPTDDDRPPECFRCQGTEIDLAHVAAHLYVLGQYLGDGHLVTSARVPVLRVYTCADYPRILDELDAAVEKIRGHPPGHVFPRRSARLVNLQSYWNHWPCLLPQHGPGMKHTRPIVLTDWQQVMVDADPRPLVRGLIHSDGCRSLNRVYTRGKWYEYPRYQFSNESADIMNIFTDALDRLGVRWRMCRPNLAAVSRRADVTALDAIVGPKT